MLNLRKVLFTNGMLGLLCASLFGLECNENSCKYFRIGVGGAYHSLDSKNADISSVGGYLAFSARGALKQRIASEIGGKVGLSSASSTGAYFEQLPYTKNSLAVFTDFYFKIGLNISSVNVPIFINAVYGWDNFSTNLKNKGIGFSRDFVGGELDGFLPTSNTSRIEYLAGYYYFLNGDYLLADTNAAYKFQGTNFMLKASLGYTGDITPQLGYYIKIIGKYEDIKQSKSVTDTSYPATSNVAGMLEFGLEI